MAGKQEVTIYKPSAVKKLLKSRLIKCEKYVINCGGVSSTIFGMSQGDSGSHQQINVEDAISQEVHSINKNFIAIKTPSNIFEVTYSRGQGDKLTVEYYEQRERYTLTASDNVIDHKKNCSRIANDMFLIGYDITSE